MPPEHDRPTDTEFAFPFERKEPLNDAAHVRNAIARFDQVQGVTAKYGVHVSEDDWRDLFSRREPEGQDRG